MKELKCPKCGAVISVDEAEYESLLSQVKTTEFEAEVSARVQQATQLLNAEQQKQQIEAQSNFREQMAQKENALTAKDGTIQQLQQQLSQLEEVARAKMSAELAKKETELNEVRQKANNAVLLERNKQAATLSEKDAQIARLQAEMALKEKEANMQLTSQKSSFEERLKFAQEEIERYKDFKARLSTKMIGESLEQHCSTEFNKMRPLFPNAYFDKDNDASGGSKGDFIFRDYVDGVEYLSIMFEMKNEADETATKHENKDFFKKLNDDRTKKNCEWAVLVSTLEPDSELYNTGIVDVSYLYPKMLVIRPQFFMQLIGLLTQTSKTSLEYKRELVVARQQSVDVTNFESKLGEFKRLFGDHYRLASEKYDSAIKQIDASIAALQKVKDFLQGSEDHLRLANKKVDDLTIKSLTKGNETMKRLFEEASSRGE